MIKLTMSDALAASMVCNTSDHESARVMGRYEAICRDKDGNVKWTEQYDNLVTDVGARKMLDTILGNSSAGAVVLGLKGTGAAAFADTQASHAGWLEVGNANAPAYGTNRPTPSFSAAAGATGSGNRSKQTSAAVTYTFSSGGTVAGSFINIGGAAAIDNTTGTLFSAGDFGASRTVVASDQLQVTYTLSA